MQTKAVELWAQVRSLLAEQLPADVFERWIDVIEPLDFENNTLKLGVANDFYQTWLEENYLPLIREALAALTGKNIKTEFCVVSSPQGIPTTVPTARPDPSAFVARSANLGSALNPRYTFENFIVGASNDFAHAAARAVAESPARAYNPLFIYGGVGLGKTHLMQAIGHYVLAKKSCKVCYTSCEAFTNEFIEALQNHSLPAFRKKYRGIDVLLIDDIHFLAGKERMQEEFFHTFNTLHDNHKQIVMTSDRPANEIPGIEQRLVSRFEWGLVTQLEPPDMETRLAILRKKQEQLAVRLPDAALTFIAEHIRSNIRRLEGALIRLASYLSLHHQPVTEELLRRVLHDLLEQEAITEVRPEDIMRAVAEHFDLRLADLTGKQRPQYIALPRQIAMYLCRQLTPLSLPSIGSTFGRNHATVLHACRTIDERIRRDPNFAKTIQAIKDQLRKNASQL